jgi:hypothetical protein
MWLVAITYGQDNEKPSSVECGKFLDQLSNSQLLIHPLILAVISVMS